MEYIDIVKVLETCADFLTEPTNKEYESAFNELKSNIVIRQYLSVSEKEMVLQKTILDIKQSDESPFSYVINTEISLTFNALLAYTNIDSEILDAAKDPQFYDLLWQSGLCDYILQYCQRDYDRLCDMVFHMLSYENLFVLVDELKGLNSEDIARLTDEFKMFRLETKPESLIALGNIAASSDPLLTTIKASVESAAYDAISQDS